MIVSLGANKKRILAVLVLIAIAVSAFFLIPRGEKRQTFPGMTGEERLAFLTSFGWEAEAEPQDVREVVIPAKFNDVYAAYNTMQQAQGFDLFCPMPAKSARNTATASQTTRIRPMASSQRSSSLKAISSAAMSRPAQRMVSCTALRQTAPAMRCRSRSSKRARRPRRTPANPHKIQRKVKQHETR